MAPELGDVEDEVGAGAFGSRCGIEMVEGFQGGLKLVARLGLSTVAP
ncbi:hypothetical protein [Nocardia sp. NPDC049707]